MTLQHQREQQFWQCGPSTICKTRWLGRAAGCPHAPEMLLHQEKWCWCCYGVGGALLLGWFFFNLFEEPKIPLQPKYLKISTAVCSEKVKVISFAAMLSKWCIKPNKCRSKQIKSSPLRPVEEHPPGSSRMRLLPGWGFYHKQPGESSLFELGAGGNPVKDLLSWLLLLQHTEDAIVHHDISARICWSKASSSKTTDFQMLCPSIPVPSLQKEKARAPCSSSFCAWDLYTWTGP